MYRYGRIDSWNCQLLASPRADARKALALSGHYEAYGRHSPWDINRPLSDVTYRLLFQLFPDIVRPIFRLPRFGSPLARAESC